MRLEHWVLGTAQISCARFCLRRSKTGWISIRFAEEPSDRNFERFGDCRQLIVHQVACMVFDSRNCSLIDADAARRQSASQILLGNRRLALQTSLTDPSTNNISLRKLGGLLHQHVDFTCLTFSGTGGRYYVDFAYYICCGVIRRPMTGAEPWQP
jgi:hypothetical protein